jgi:hypothetical protein
MDADELDALVLQPLEQTLELGWVCELPDQGGSSPSGSTLMPPKADANRSLNRPRTPILYRVGSTGTASISAG